MKSILLFTLIAFLGSSIPGISQDLKYDSEAEYLKKTYGKEKRKMVESFLKLSDEEATKFWPIYDEYEKSRADFGERRWKLLNQYNEQYRQVENFLADRWLDTIFNYRNEYLDRMEVFVYMVEAELGPKRALEVYELESYIRAGTRRYLANNAAFLGEGELKKETMGNHKKEKE